MGCLKGIVFLLLLAGLAVFGYLNRDRLQSTWYKVRGQSEPAKIVPSKELSDAAAAKLKDLTNGKKTMIALTEVELQSLLQYKYRSLLPAFVDSPRVELNGSKIEVSARVPVDHLPQLSELGDAATFLPDTADVGVTGELLPLRAGRAALAVDQVRAARIPLPGRLIPGALRKLGRKDEDGLPKDALSIPLPPGANSAYVRGDSLFFLANAKQ